MEITQFTYFQQVGGLELDLIPAEITYGLDRLAMVSRTSRRSSTSSGREGITWGDVYRENERQWSHYNFEEADVECCCGTSTTTRRSARRLIERGLPLPAYDLVLKCSHAFNLLDARGAISVTERAAYIGRVRNLVRARRAALSRARGGHDAAGCCLRSAARSCRPPPACEAALQLPELCARAPRREPTELFVGPRRLAFPVDVPERTDGRPG